MFNRAYQIIIYTLITLFFISCTSSPRYGISSNENKQIVKCNSGYNFLMPKEEIDSKSCKLERYRVNLGGSYTIKESLKCKDFENENIITIY